MSKPRPPAGETTTLDWLMGGQLAIRQPVAGHRGGTDTLLLAAAAPQRSGVLVDMGAGVGTAGLAVARRGGCENLVLVEIQPELAELAHENIERNGLSGLAQAVTADVLTAAGRRAGGLTNGMAEAVIANPPYLTPGRSQTSPDASRALAHSLSDGGIEAWLRAASALLRPGGSFAVIQRTDALQALLAACGSRFGALEIWPIYPKAGEPSHRIILRGIKGSRAPLCVMPPVILHEADGVFTPHALALHEGRALLGPGGTQESS
jgi:tRNA1(Val) A37 N6-methylase TrmN6